MSIENLFLLSIFALNGIKATSTLASSVESGWSNVQADSALISIEQYHSLQARFSKMQQEHSNLVKQCELSSAKNSMLKHVSLHDRLKQLVHT